jgi:hypothetical protein
VDYQQWHRHLEYRRMQDYFDTEFWDLVYEEYGVTDELDILSENVTQIITPAPGVIILITQEFYGKES